MRALSLRHVFAGLALSVGAVLSSASGCVIVESIFTCSTDQNCIDEVGEGAVCEANNQCTFVDETCENGKRWHVRAVEELREQCFDPAQLEGGGTEPAGSSGDDVAGTSEPPAEDSSGGMPSDSTGMVSDGSTGVAQTCDDQFGTAPGYELCEETEHSCVFNAVLDQSTCTAMCEMFGATCVGATNNDAGDCASAAGDVSCEEMANDQICTCAK